MTTYSLQVFPLGHTQVPGPEVYWMSGWDTWLPVTFNAVVIQGGDRVVLVNTGGPDDLGELSARWMSVFGERGRFRRAADETIVAQLERLGLDVAAITDVVVTPFQLYSTSGLPLFDHARIHLSKRGWVHFHTTHDHPHDDRWSSLSPAVLTYLVVDAWDRVHLLEDEDEVAPGIRTWFSGAHHRASIAVEVDTHEGTVVVSDSFFHYGNVEDDRVLGISENMYEALATYERTRQVADHVVPLYDPAVYDRYPDGQVAP